MHSKQIALHDVHVALGAKMIPFAGFNMPVRYSSDIDEHLAVRQRVGVFDVSHMGEFRLKGDKALDLLQLITTNDVSKLVHGKAQYSCMTNNEGGIIDDLIVYCWDKNEYYVVVNASNIQKDWDWISKHNHFGVEIENLSDQLGLLAVQGPQAIHVLQKITSIDLSSIPYYSFITGKIGGIDDVIISNTGYTGAGGFELYVWNKDIKEAWDAIFKAGKEFSIQPIGLGARDTLRLEMGYCLYGNDINDSTTPLEAGLGWITKFDKSFIASDQLKKQKEVGVKKKLIGFEMVDRGIPRGHYEICNTSHEQIGEVTSGTQSPSLGKGIGMGYVKVDYSKVGTNLYINIRGNYVKAQIVKMPFYQK